MKNKGSLNLLIGFIYGLDLTYFAFSYQPGDILISFLQVFQLLILRSIIYNNKLL